MINLEYTRLPSYFIYYLKRNMQSSSEDFAALKAELRKNKSFYILVHNAFSTFDSKIKVENIINSVGWHKFRDCIAASFIFYELEDHFPTSYDEELVKDIITFENRIDFHYSDGNSRPFLLVFYIKMLLAKNPDNKSISNLNGLIQSKEISEYLRLSDLKTMEIDWLILFLHHLRSYLGYDVLMTCLKKRMSFDKLIHSLTKGQKRELFSNMLAYGSSIDAPEVFYSKF